MALYLIGSGAMQTTAAFATIATSTAIKTLMQVRPSATIAAKVVEWGISFDGSAAATPGKIELIETDVAATVTAFGSSDITKLDSDAIAGGDPTTNLIQCSTVQSGFNATAEGSITSVRNLDGPQLIAPTNQYIKQYPLGREPTIQVNKYARIRVTMTASVNAYAYMMLAI